MVGSTSTKRMSSRLVRNGSTCAVPVSSSSTDWRPPGYSSTIRLASAAGRLTVERHPDRPHGPLSQPVDRQRRALVLGVGGPGRARVAVDRRDRRAPSVVDRGGRRPHVHQLVALDEPLERIPVHWGDHRRDRVRRSRRRDGPCGRELPAPRPSRRDRRRSARRHRHSRTPRATQRWRTAGWRREVPSEQGRAAARASCPRRPRRSGPPPGPAAARTGPHPPTLSPFVRPGGSGIETGRPGRAAWTALFPESVCTRTRATSSSSGAAMTTSRSGRPWGSRTRPRPTAVDPASALTARPCRPVRRRLRTAASPGAPGPGCPRTLPMTTLPGAGRRGSAPASPSDRHPTCSPGLEHPAGPRPRQREWPTCRPGSVRSSSPDDEGRR